MADKRLAKYGVAYILNFELYEIDGIDLKIDAADGGTDCTIRKDQGADTTATNDFVDEGLSYSLTITATEMQAKEVTVHIIDSATKVYLDKVLVIETYGNASALHSMDFDDFTTPAQLVDDILDETGSVALVGNPTSLRELIYYEVQVVRNKLEYVKATDKMKLYEDDNVADKWEHTMLDDATEATRGKGA